MASYIPQPGDGFTNAQYAPQQGYGGYAPQSQGAYGTGVGSGGYQDPGGSMYQNPQSTYAQAQSGYGQGGYGQDPGSYGQHQSSDGPASYHDGNSSLVAEAGHENYNSQQQQQQSMHSYGDSSFVGGHPSIHDGDSSFQAGHPSTHGGNSSFQAGHPSTQADHGHDDTNSFQSDPGVPADSRGMTSHGTSVDGRASGLQVETFTEIIKNETQGRVDGFAATLRIFAELARREKDFIRGKRFYWRFITLAEAAEAGRDKSSEALRNEKEPVQNQVLVEVHGKLGGRGSNIAGHLESLERDARQDAAEIWGFHDPVDKMTESQGIAFDQVRMKQKGTPRSLADGLKNLGTPISKSQSQGGHQGGQGSHGGQGNQGGHPSDHSLERGGKQTRRSGGAGESRTPGRGTSPNPRAHEGASRQAEGPVFKSTGQQGF